MDDLAHAAMPPAPPPAAQDRPLAYDGEGGELFNIVLQNTLFGVLTLGIYRFWAKTRFRRYLWSQLSLFGDRLEYTGTPKELFLGFLVALAFLAPLFIVAGVSDAFAMQLGVALKGAIDTAFYLVLLFLIGIAMYRARRYRLTRTLWRGIRFGQTGSSVRYGLLFLGNLLLQGITLGLAKPFADMRLLRFAMENTWLGNRQFAFEGTGRALFGRWVLCLVLAPFTLGLSLLWYAAAKARYAASVTSFGDLRFDLPLTFGELARIYVPFYALVIVVYGAIGAAVAVHFAMGLVLIFGGAFVFGLAALQAVMITHRLVGLLTARLAAAGSADLDSIVQEVRELSRTGEGLADALDVGGLDFGL